MKIMLVVDGSYGEGGGQILRTAISLSALSGKSVKIINIRKNRPNPGLSNQHVTAVKSASEICNAEVKGCEKNSVTLVFRPSEIEGGRYSFDIGTAGSVTLVLQTLLPMLLKTKAEVEITGGTDVKWSPSADYFQHVFLYFLRRMGAKIEFSILRRGHYPKGGGKVVLRTEASEIEPIQLTHPGKLKKIKGRIHLSQLPENIAQRIKKASEEILAKRLQGTPFEINISFEDGTPGCGFTLWAEFENSVLGYSLCGEKGLRAENLGSLVAERVIEEINSGATVDECCSDQIIPYLACHRLFKREEGRCVEEKTLFNPLFLVRTLSSHLKTNIWVIEKFGFKVGKVSIVKKHDMLQ
ncbi:MAG TPA: RNA 3'-terminal phosphate cyclase [Thermoplasmata archaeon]|nr:RNA 3'-terminal phosphate cyclase [Thermoplasmata archaeon]